MSPPIARAAFVVAAFAAGMAATWLWMRPASIAPGGGPGAAPRLVIVGLDGADWNIIDPLLARGGMPHLQSLIERGTRARLLSFQPMLSPVLWTTIATGVRPEKHGILDFVAVSPATGQVAPVSSAQRRAPAFWNLATKGGRSVGVTAWWATWPAEEVNGYLVSDRVAYQLFGIRPAGDPAGKTWPAALYEQVQDLIVRPEAIDDARLAPFLGGVATGSTEETEILGQLRELIASSETYEGMSERLSVEFRPDIEAVYIESTDTLAHLTMRFRPPLLAGVPPGLAERFGGVVDEAYRNADRQIGEALDRAGAGANVIVLSDHGFRSGADRPITRDSRIDKGRAAEWHRKYGILVMAGPSILRGATLREATLLDIAPTILALAGLPVPDNFEGRVLSDVFDPAFLKTHPIRSESAQGGGAVLPGAAPSDPDDPGDRGEDAALFDKLISLGYLTQESLNAHNNRGILLMNKGEFSGAITEFRSALASNPGQAGVLTNMGRCLWLDGRTKEGRAELEKAIALDPSAIEARTILGNIALDAGGFAEAESRFRSVLAIEPNDTGARNSLGILMETRGEDEAAIAEYRKVTEADPDSAEGYNNVGNILKKLGRLPEAEEWYRRAIEADPAFFGSYNNLGLMLQQRGDLDGAEALYRKALDIFGRDPRIHNNLGSLFFARGQTDAALREFTEAERLDPGYAEARNSIGVVYGALGRGADEIAAYRDALKINPKYPDARYNLALALLRMGQAAEARRELDHALADAPRHLPSLLLMSRMLLSSGDAAGAAARATLATDVNPSSVAAWLARGAALQASGNRAGAIESFRRAGELDPSSTEARTALAALEP